MSRGRTQTLLVATSNPGKIHEIRGLLPVEISILSLDELGIESPEEIGRTLRENADLKALAAARKSGMLTIADDSGLEVRVLGGAPGVRSARYAGEPPNDAKNRRALLAALTDVPADNRTARFVCAVTIATPAGIIWTDEGVLHGTILDHERGTGGFGYDSVFQLSDGRTVADLLDEEKNAMSHRGAAIRAILPKLQAAISEQNAQRQLQR